MSTAVKYKVNGETVSRDEFLKNARGLDTLKPGDTAGLEVPKIRFSDALGVHPRQVAEARAHAKKHGIPVDFTPDGKCIVKGGHRMMEKYARKLGFEYCG